MTTPVPILVHAFEEDGSYGTRVRVTEAQGRTAESEVDKLVVLNSSPAAGFAVESASRDDAAAYELHSRSWDLAGEIAEWLWDFGDGTVSGVPNPVHAYADDGDSFVTLVVTDEDGAMSEPAARTVPVANSELVAAFALASAAIVVGESVRFVDESVDQSSNRSIVHVAWDFGGGDPLGGRRVRAHVRLGWNLGRCAARRRSRRRHEQRPADPLRVAGPDPTGRGGRASVHRDWRRCRLLVC